MISCSKHETIVFLTNKKFVTVNGNEKKKEINKYINKMIKIEQS